MLPLRKKEWNLNKEIYIWIFDVGRGFSSFVKTPQNYGMMIDCGSSEEFKPFEHVVKKFFLQCLDKPMQGVKKRCIAQLIVSHPHSDHCSEIETILKECNPMLLTTPHSNPKEADMKQHVNWELVDNPPYGESAVKCLKDDINKRFPPLRPYIAEPGFAVPNFKLDIFQIPPKVCEIDLPRSDYTNNLSIVVYMSVGENSILFMGDLMPSGCEYLLVNNSRFRKIVERGVKVVVVPHHGLESGFCRAFYDAMPGGRVGTLNIISEKRLTGDNQGSTHPFYTSNQSALGYRGRYSLSTRYDGHIRIVMGAGNKLNIDADKDIQSLLQ